MLPGLPVTSVWVPGSPDDGIASGEERFKLPGSADSFEEWFT